MLFELTWVRGARLELELSIYVIYTLIVNQALSERLVQDPRKKTDDISFQTRSRRTSLISWLPRRIDIRKQFFIFRVLL